MVVERTFGMAHLQLSGRLDMRQADQRIGRSRLQERPIGRVTGRMVYKIQEEERDKKLLPDHLLNI